MPELDGNRRFQDALAQARHAWASANPARAAGLAGCTLTPAGILVPFFGRPHLVTHPDGLAGLWQPAASVGSPSPAALQPVHASINILLLHYLLTADGTPPADRWIAFRELPDGLFYAQAFAAHAELPLAQRFGVPADTPAGRAALEELRRAAATLSGTPLDLADASYRFQALPRVAMAVLVWQGDEEFPGQARVLFDAHASHYLPTEDLSGVGEWLAHRFVRATTDTRPR